MLLDWLWFSAFLFGIFGLIAGGNYISSNNWLQSSHIRKTLHVIISILIFFSPYLFQSKWLPLSLTMLFAVFNFISIRKEWFAGFFGIDRKSYGTVYFPVAFAILIFFYWETQPYVLQLCALILGFGDPLAAIVGSNVRFKKTFIMHKSIKSVEGSSMMFLVTFICVVAAGIYHILPEIPILHLFLLGTFIAFFAALSEALFDDGIDNISIPLTVALFLDYLLFDINIVFDLWVISVAIMPFVYLTYRLKFLNLGGSVAAYIMAVIMLGMGGWAWMLPLLAFFLLSSVLTFLTHYIRRSSGNIVEKTGARDPIQVMANGGPALLIFILAMNNLWPWAYPVFLIAVASATADTWSTEFGQLLSRGKAFDPFRFRFVEKGISGGMSIPGTIGGLLGSCAISFLISYQNDYYVERPDDMFILIAVSGFFGMIADSAIGSYLQGKFECVMCGVHHEKLNHCGQPSRLIKGYHWLSNDLVNFVSIFSAVIFGVIAYNLFYKL